MKPVKMKDLEKHFTPAIRYIMFRCKIPEQQDEFLCQRNFKNVQATLAVIRYLSQFEILDQFIAVFIFPVDDTNTIGRNILCKQLFYPQCYVDYFLPLGIIR